MAAKVKWRKWFRVIHRDFGYLFFGLTIIYAISGIALNHLDDWNPNYIVSTVDIRVDDPAILNKQITRDQVKELLAEYEIESLYKNHYFPAEGVIKIFLDGGSAVINTESGEGIIERVVRRPMFREMNYLHYNPVRTWTFVSDIYAGALAILAITGLFLVRGKKGITGRGAWMTIIGIVLPIIFLFIYFY